MAVKISVSARRKGRVVARDTVVVPDGADSAIAMRQLMAAHKETLDKDSTLRHGRRQGYRKRKDKNI